MNYSRCRHSRRQRMTLQPRAVWRAAGSPHRVLADKAASSDDNEKAGVKKSRRQLTDGGRDCFLNLYSTHHVKRRLSIYRTKYCLTEHFPSQDTEDHILGFRDDQHAQKTRRRRLPNPGLRRLLRRSPIHFRLAVLNWRDHLKAPTSAKLPISPHGVR